MAEAQDDEIWISMPPEQLDMTINRPKSVGLKYPLPVYQMPQMTPDPTSTLVRQARR